MFELHSDSGVAVTLTNFGATLMRILAPDRDGRPGNVLLGHDRVADYPAAGGDGPDAYMGATCGRYANRIAGAALLLDGRRHALAANEGGNLLHGGVTGFHRRIWDVAHADARSVVLRLTSADGDQGFPGELAAQAEFALSPEGELAIRYSATTTRPTHVNLVSHGYFNLSGGADPTILDHRLRIAAGEMLEIDGAAIPTGRRLAVRGTPFDFAAPRRIGEAIALPDPQLAIGRGYNHNYVLPGEGLREVAMLHHPPSGRAMTVATDQPGLQFYSGDWLAAPFRPRQGLCLEAQAWPDSPNRPDFPSTRLDPGGTYCSETRLRFDVRDAAR